MAACPSLYRDLFVCDPRSINIRGYIVYTACGKGAQASFDLIFCSQNSFLFIYISICIESLLEELSNNARCRTACLKKNLNAPRPSEHPPVRGKTVVQG